MKFRKLECAEHEKTRLVWEHIFQEDTCAFLDYYYNQKTRENEIYAVEDEEQIVSMLHLNPYQVRVQDDAYLLHYIVAVATEVPYRRRGLMGQLLRYSMREMYERKEPFTFLMPAAEAIYYPYDFRFIYRQKRGVFCGRKHRGDGLTITLATKADCDEIASFVEEKLQDYQVVAKRDEAYYQLLLKEQQSEHGGIVLTRRGSKLTGVFPYARGEQFEFREPVFEEEADFRCAIYFVTGDCTTKIHCTGYGDEPEVPIIMARILHLETFLKCFRLTDCVDFYVKIEDAIIAENNQVFHIVGNPVGGVTNVTACTAEVELEGAITIGDLTTLLFGYKANCSGEIKEHLLKAFEKFVPLSKVFLNEVV